MILKSVLKGVAAAAILLVFYFLVLTLVSGRSFALIQFSQNWYWILGLSSGFGIQVGIFIYLNISHRNQISAKPVAISGTTSTIAMISCCSHYLANILPVIGISGLVVIVGQYQTELFYVGLISNLLGVIYMIGKLIKFKKAEAEI